MTLSLYAIVEGRPETPLGKGIAGRPLTSVRVGKAWVVVEEGSAPAASPKTVVAYDRVIRRLARGASAILPLRFASTAPDRKALATLLAPLAGPIATAFDRVRDAVQFTLKVEGPAARRAREARTSARTGPGTRWLARRSAEQRVPEIEPVTEATRPFVREVRVQRHDRGAAAAPDGRLATVYHLVPRANLAAWKRALARALPLLGPTSVTASGPWPAYAFAELG